MNNEMSHRGSDDAGIYQAKLSNGQYLGLGQRRSSILDLSLAGHQPMLSQDKQVIIVYNGEMYNYLKLKNQLERKGYCFRSMCDTEVRQGKVVLARDRMGKKPLYYYIDQNVKTMVFASELKPIMVFPEFHKEIRTELISGYFSTVITALAQKVSMKPVKTYTIGFSTQKKNEVRKDCC